MEPEDIRHLRNIGIVAHVDAGKTTLAEQMLYLSGQIRAVGRVDDGTTQLDWLPAEKDRGITVLAATTIFDWKGHRINLIDTPGHVDFSSETQRSLRILDGVIVVLSGVEGVQAHTLTLWRAIQSLEIPAIFFVNKMDRIGTSGKRTLSEIHEKLTPHAILLQETLWDEDTFQGIYPILSSDPVARSGLIESLADRDDAVLERFIQDEPMDDEWLRERLSLQAQQARVFPVLIGSALRGIGVESVLDGILDFLPPPQTASSDVLSAVVFKIQREPRMGRMAFVRVYGGALRNRELVENQSRNVTEKISQIRKVSANAYEDVGLVSAGDIAALCGLEQTRIGDVLGSPEPIPAMPDMPVPVFQVKAFPLQSPQPQLGLLDDSDQADVSKDQAAYVALAEALHELEDEDPSLAIHWNPDIREIRVRVMGVVQIEILQHILADRFGLHAGFGTPTVVFKETPAQKGYGNVSYTSIPHWAVMRFLIEPAPRGSGLEYHCIVRPGELKIRYQREVARRVPMALEQGLKGWEVTDLKITMVSGSHHEQHTHPLDFVAATGWAMEDGLANCGTRLLEPILNFRIDAPPEIGGRICNELYNRRASFDRPAFHPEQFSLEGQIPAATSLDLPVLIQQWSGGKASMITDLARYDLAPEEYNHDSANFQPKRPQVSFRTYM